MFMTESIEIKKATWFTLVVLVWVNLGRLKLNLTMQAFQPCDGCAYPLYLETCGCPVNLTGKVLNSSIVTSTQAVHRMRQLNFESQTEKQLGQKLSFCPANTTIGYAIIYGGNETYASALAGAHRRRLAVQRPRRFLAAPPTEVRQVRRRRTACRERLNTAAERFGKCTLDSYTIPVPFRPGASISTTQPAHRPPAQLFRRPYLYFPHRMTVFSTATTST